jgi:hypothetical protein
VRFSVVEGKLAVVDVEVNNCWQQAVATVRGCDRNAQNDGLAILAPSDAKLYPHMQQGE